MKNSKLKIAICLMWLIGVVGFIFVQKSVTVNAKGNAAIPKPDLQEVEKFNALILNRFLMEPGFGFGPMVPTPQPALHLLTYNTQIGKADFSPKEGDEKNAIMKFENKDWKVGLYLFGKSASKIYTRTDLPPKIEIDYRLFKPIAITKNIKENELIRPENLLEKAKTAFDEFQINAKEKDKKLEFNSNGWWYLAKPVRAVSQSCVGCHSDNLVPMPLRTVKFTFRTRQIGDVNCVLVYAFQKVKK